MFFLYDCFMTLLQPIFSYIAKKSKNPRVLKERFAHATQKRPNGKLIWVHGASLGEIKALEPLLEGLSSLPNTHLLLTTSSRRSLNGIVQFINSRWTHQFIPFDVPRLRKKFLTHWAPSAVIWTESDFWPGFVKESHKLKIPLFLVNGKLSRKTMKRWKFFPLFFKSFLNLFDDIYAQSQEDQKNFQEFGIKKAQFCGNFKFLQTLSLPSKKTVDSYKEKIKRPFFWLAACTHPGEEEIVAQVHTFLQKKEKNITTFLAPRHPKRAKDIKQSLEKKGFSTAFHSTHPQSQPIDVDFYIIDTFGDLSLFYALSPFCFLGGTFSHIGGHSPIEALKNQCCLFVGPHIFSNKSLYTPFIDSGAIYICETQSELQKKVLNALEDSEKIKDVYPKIDVLLKKESEKVKKVLENVKKVLETRLN